MSVNHRASKALECTGDALCFEVVAGSWSVVALGDDVAGCIGSVFPQGYCYLALVKKGCRPAVAQSLGAYPSFSTLLKLPVEDLIFITGMRVVTTHTGWHHLQVGGHFGIPVIDVLKAVVLSTGKAFSRDGTLGSFLFGERNKIGIICDLNVEDRLGGGSGCHNVGIKSAVRSLVIRDLIPYNRYFLSRGSGVTFSAEFTVGEETVQSVIFPIGYNYVETQPGSKVLIQFRSKAVLSFGEISVLPGDLRMMLLDNFSIFRVIGEDAVAVVHRVSDVDWNELQFVYGLSGEGCHLGIASAHLGALVSLSGNALMSRSESQARGGVLKKKLRSSKDTFRRAFEAELVAGAGESVSKGQGYLTVVSGKAELGRSVVADTGAVVHLAAETRVSMVNQRHVVRPAAYELRRLEDIEPLANMDFDTDHVMGRW